jgi:hypothetical protein
MWAEYTTQNRPVTLDKISPNVPLSANIFIVVYEEKYCYTRRWTKTKEILNDAAK